MSMFFLHSYNNIPTTCILKIISKGTDAAIYCIWIPTFLIFKLIAFHCTSTKKAFYVNWQCHFFFV